MLPIISFIVPIYNCANWVRNCIQSIINKNIENYEIIIIDDFSTDNSLKVLDDYSHIKNIFIYKNSRKGVSSARNLGIIKSRGKYLCFVDADDYICGNWMTISNLEKEDSDLILSQIYDKYIGGDSYVSAEEFLVNIDKNDLTFRIGTLWGKFYLRQVILDNRIFFDKNLSIGEDTEFNLEYFYYAKKIRLFDEKIYIHQDVNPFSLSKICTPKNEQKKRILGNLKSLLEYNNVTCEKYIAKKGEKYFGTAS